MLSNQENHPHKLYKIHYNPNRYRSLNQGISHRYILNNYLDLLHILNMANYITYKYFLQGNN